MLNLKKYFKLSVILVSSTVVLSCGDGVSGVTSSTTLTSCGDGVKNPGEVCDDGNRINGDGCSANCKSLEVCGNNITDLGEECDGESWCDENCRDTRITDTDSDGDTITNDQEGRFDNIDTDSDGKLDFLDTDSDNDGIPDSVEAGDSDPLTPPVDSDGDGTPDFRDTDSDEDGIPDLVETDDDADGDTIPNYLDDDSDGDTISDLTEGYEDIDHDGVPNFLDDDSDGDGIPDKVEIENGLDPYDSDTDNDGISDGIEGIGDEDGDGIINALDDDSDGDGIPDLVETSADTDGDGIRNFLDDDSDGDGLSDTYEGTDDLDGDGLGNFMDTDSDGDRVSDANELVYGLDPYDSDTDGDFIKDGDDGLVDTDGDGVINALDLDSDGDGFSDNLEAGDNDLSTIPVDTDGDGLFDFVDVDSDNDGLADIDEPDCVALGKHGRFYVDTDGDGNSDLAELSVTGFESDPCDPNDDLSTNGVEFYFELPYKGHQQNDILYFNPTVQMADVFFNIDTTGSMDGEISELKNGLSGFIIPQVNSRVTDSAFGVAQWEDFPVSPFGGASDKPFLLLQQLTTNPGTAQTGVNALTTHWGNDWPESGFESLYLLSTYGGSNNYYTPPATNTTRGGVGFRWGSLPIVLHITDAPSHYPGASYNSYSNYPTTYGAHTRDQAISSLNNLGARVITVDSGTSTYIGDAWGQLTDISNSTNARIPVCAFKTDATHWRCGDDKCCTGLNSTGVDPDSSEMCTLKYIIASNGTGLGSAIVDGIDGLVKYTTFNIYAVIRDDGDPGTIDTSCFIQRVEALNYIAPPDEPEASCTPAAYAAKFNTTTYNDGFMNFATGTSSSTQQGSQLTFRVDAENYNCVPPSSETQIYQAYIDLYDQVTGTLLDTQEVVIVVPPVL